MLNKRKDIRLNLCKRVKPREIGAIYRMLSHEMEIPVPYFLCFDWDDPKKVAHAIYYVKEGKIIFFKSGLTLRTTLHEWAHHVIVERGLPCNSHGKIFKDHLKESHQVFRGLVADGYTFYEGKIIKEK